MDYSLDSISNLPDEILGKILSLLPTKVATSTSVLSKRWKNLLVLVDSLCFDDDLFEYSDEEKSITCSHGFSDFVVKTCDLLSSSLIKKFSLSHLPRRGHDHFDNAYDFDDAYSRVHRWICTAMERGLLELHLHARYNGVLLETKLLTSNTLVKLTLSGEYSLEVERVFFPALKSLSLLSVLRLDCNNYGRLLDGCPVLEELFISETDHSDPLCCCEFVESRSVKRLVIFVNLPDSKEFHDVVHIKAPSLEYLDYSSYVSENYELDDLDSIVEARLSLKLWESTNDHDYDDDSYYFDGNYYDDDDDGYYFSFGEPKPAISGDVTNLVTGISNITTLHLSPGSLEAFHFCCTSIPVFKNLLNLSIESNKENGWQVMPLLLKSCPILQTLVIKGLVHRVTNRCGDACACIPKNPRQKKKKRKIVKKEEEKVCCLWTCPVKVLEILEYAGSFQELKQLRHFLGKLECLNTVKVGVVADNNSEFLRANLLTLPRLSSKCNIQFI